MSTVTVPVFGFGIRPRGPSTLPSLPTARIMSGRRNHGVEIHEAALDLVDQLLAADHVGARFGRFLLLLAAGDRQHALALAEAVRKDDRAAHHLVRVLGIDAEAERHVHRLVELGVLHLLHQRNRFLDRVDLIDRNLRLGSGEFLAVLFHELSCGASGPRWSSHATNCQVLNADG